MWKATSRVCVISRQREALVLRYFADLPENEIALAMGVSRGTVKSTTARALAAGASTLHWMLAFLHAQRGAFRPPHIGRIRLHGGGAAIRIMFMAPSPL